MNIWLTLQEQGVVMGSAGQTAAAAVMILNTTLAKVTSQGSLRDLGQQPRHHLNKLINISKLGLVFIFTSTGTPNARLDFFLSESPPLKTPLKIIFLARNFLCDLI